MKAGTQNHPKFKRLMRVLGIPEYQAIGLLEAVWLMTANSAWGGDLGKHSDEDIAATIDWRGDPEKLVAALIETGWLDPVEDERRLVVHDWEDHCPEYIRKRFVRQSKSREKPKPSSVNGGQRQPPSDSVGQRQTESADGALTKPNQVYSNQANSREEDLPADAGPTPQDVVDEWNQVVGVAGCRKLTETKKRAFKARLEDSDWCENWREAIERVRCSPFCTGDNDRGWKADIDWFLRPDTVTRLLEGAFDGKTGRPNGTAEFDQEAEIAEFMSEES